LPSLLWAARPGLSCRPYAGRVSPESADAVDREPSAAADAGGADLSEAVWALWTEVSALRQARDANGAGGDALAELRAAVGALRDDVIERLAGLDPGKTALATSVQTVQVALGVFREEVLQALLQRDSRETVLAASTQALHAAFGDLREDLKRETLERASSEAALAAALQSLHAALDDVREDLKREKLERASSEAVVASALQALHAEVAAMNAQLSAGKDAVAELHGLVDRTRRDQEGLAFALADATHEMQDRVDYVQRANVDAGRELAERVTAAITDADASLQRVRAALLERMEALAAMADLGLAESMVAVLEDLRADVHGLREDVAALGRRHHLTAAQVRKIVKELHEEPGSPSPPGGKRGGR